ncbi:helix-turn-helix transcriptional regulator [Streptomyces hoynatensis]|uniref:helix-turn-helix transcriptional regulator n=1 Tax=Streptomyces hoynatensis TaxID=1141874 RepID=UPI001F4D5051|nr:helix-turn-helix transcriptional regulator [Streptomyces hoynatensis]
MAAASPPGKHRPAPAARAPRRLPEGPLAPGDYRRLFLLIESVDQAPDLCAFLSGLHAALRDWFGYPALAVGHGRTLAEALPAGHGGHGDHSRAFLARYAERWAAATDPFRGAAARRLLAQRRVVTLRELCPGRDRARHDYVQRFLAPHGVADRVGMVVEGGSEGVVFAGAAVAGPGPVPARDLAALRALSRHLAPHVAGQLARHRAAASAADGFGLTPREREVAALVVQGLTNEQVARRLFIGVGTVKKHLTRVLAKTHTTTRTQLAIRWRER